LVENEVIFRSVNKDVATFINDDPELSGEDTALFYCECSKPECLEKIKLTAKEYGELHQSNKHFVILIGHEHPEVEKVIEKTKNYEVVEKYFKPPKADDISMKLKTISKSL
jgi:hypothetical protein